MATFQDSTTLPESRTALEALIEAAIARLDEIDGDPDIEPSLGSNLGVEWGGTYWPPAWETERMPAVPDECEDACEDEGACADDEPTLGAPKGVEPPGVDVGRWLAGRADRLDDAGPWELSRVTGATQDGWAAGGDSNEREDVSEDEGAQDDREPDEGDWDPHSEDEGGAGLLTAFDPIAEREAQLRTAEACHAAVEELRGIQRRAGKKPAQPLRTICGAIMR